MNPRRRKKRCRKTGKIRWIGKLEAQIALANTARRGRDEQREYECPHCGDWHLTKTPKRGRMAA